MNPPLKSKSPTQDGPDARECFLAFELGEDCCAYLQTPLTTLQQKLDANDWPMYRVPADKWHASLLYFEKLSADERAIVLAEVQAAADRGAWKEPGFRWRGLAFWPSPRVVVLASEKYSALAHWGLQSWRDHPICGKGQFKPLNSYAPHFTMMRLLQKYTSESPRNKWVAKWEDIRDQLEPIDPMRIRVDRISLFLSDYSQGRHRYIREGTVEI